MADASPELDEERMAAGRAILELTDQFSFDALAAGWINPAGTDHWLYFLVTPMLSTKGPSWIYTRLMQIFRRHPLPAGISPLDVYILDPVLEQAAFGRQFIAFDERSFPAGVEAVFAQPVEVVIAQPIELRDTVIAEGKAIFYRRVPSSLRGTRENPAIRFGAKVDRLVAA